MKGCEQLTWRGDTRGTRRAECEDRQSLGAARRAFRGPGATPAGRPARPSSGHSQERSRPRP